MFWARGLVPTGAPVRCVGLERHACRACRGGLNLCKFPAASAPRLSPRRSVELVRQSGTLLRRFSFSECDGGPHEFRGVRRSNLLVRGWLVCSSPFLFPDQCSFEHSTMWAAWVPGCAPCPPVLVRRWLNSANVRSVFGRWAAWAVRRAPHTPVRARGCKWESEAHAGQLSTVTSSCCTSRCLAAGIDHALSMV